MCVPCSMERLRGSLPMDERSPRLPFIFSLLCFYCASEELKESIGGERWGRVIGQKLGDSFSIREALMLYSNLHV